MQSKVDQERLRGQACVGGRNHLRHTEGCASRHINKNQSCTVQYCIYPEPWAVHRYEAIFERWLSPCGSASHACWGPSRQAGYSTVSGLWRDSIFTASARHKDTSTQSARLHGCTALAPDTTPKPDASHCQPSTEYTSFRMFGWQTGQCGQLG